MNFGYTNNVRPLMQDEHLRYMPVNGFMDKHCALIKKYDEEYKHRRSTSDACYAWFKAETARMKALGLYAEKK